MRAMVTTAKPRPRSAEPALGFNLAAITLIIALAGLGVAYGLDAFEKQRADARASTEGKLISSNIGGHQLAIPAAWLPDGTTDSSDFASRIDLSVGIPLGPDGGVEQVDVTLVPRSQARPSATLLDGVYLHMFDSQQLSGPPGLIGKPLQATEGYTGETVWYDPLSSSPFVAKCMAPIAEKVPSRCLRTVALAQGISAIYGFNANLLPRWRDFDLAMNAKLKQIGAL